MQNQMIQNSEFIGTKVLWVPPPQSLTNPSIYLHSCFYLRSPSVIILNLAHRTRPRLVSRLPAPVHLPHSISHISPIADATASLQLKPLPGSHCLQDKVQPPPRLWLQILPDPGPLSPASLACPSLPSPTPTSCSSSVVHRQETATAGLKASLSLYDRLSRALLFLLGTGQFPPCLPLV